MFYLCVKQQVKMFFINFIKELNKVFHRLIMKLLKYFLIKSSLVFHLISRCVYAGKVVDDFGLCVSAITGSLEELAGCQRLDLFCILKIHNKLQQKILSLSCHGRLMV